MKEYLIMIKTGELQKDKSPIIISSSLFSFCHLISFSCCSFTCASIKISMRMVFNKIGKGESSSLPMAPILHLSSRIPVRHPF